MSLFCKSCRTFTRGFWQRTLMGCGWPCSLFGFAGLMRRRNVQARRRRLIASGAIWRERISTAAADRAQRRRARKLLERNQDIRDALREGR